MNQDEIKLQAKEIMDNFMGAMKDIEVEEDFVLIRENSTRVEGEGLDADPDFKNRFLTNAPKISGDAILANKGDWEN